MDTISLRRANKILKRIQLKDNDIVLVKKGSEMAKLDNMDVFAKEVHKAGFRGVILVVVDELDDLRKIDQYQMAEHGWFRADSVASQIMQRFVKDEDNKNDE